MSSELPERRDAQSFWLCQAAKDNAVHPFCTFSDRIVTRRFVRQLAGSVSAPGYIPLTTFVMITIEHIPDGLPGHPDGPHLIKFTQVCGTYGMTQHRIYIYT